MRGARLPTFDPCVGFSAVKRAQQTVNGLMMVALPVAGPLSLLSFKFGLVR
jgi:hypothetical protein